MSKLRTFIKNPIRSVKYKLSEREDNRIRYLLQPEVYCKLSDKKAIKVRYKYLFGKYPDLRHPKTYNEKLQWMKLYDRRPEYPLMVDKAEAKKIAGKIIGDEHIIQTLGVWNSAEEIDFQDLPRQFVLKCTHDSASVLICKDKSLFDIETAKKKLESCLKKNQYLFLREWPYKNLTPRIIAEEYIEDRATSELRDYKFFCFDGHVKALFITTDRQNENKPTCFDFFDRDFHHLPFTISCPNAECEMEKPSKYYEMVQIAERLSKDYPHVRVDLYEANGKVYFGEFTFFPSGGFCHFSSDEWNYTFGSWLKLPKKKIKEKKQ